MFKIFKSEKIPNYQDLIKFIAIIGMFIDHIGYFFVDDSWLRLIGRYCFPPFFFLAGYNYYHVKKREGGIFCLQLKRYREILVIGIILQILLNLYATYSPWNALISILIGLTCLDLVYRFKLPNLFSHFVMLLLSISTYSIFDYGTVGVAFVFLGYQAHIAKDNNYKVLLFVWLILQAFFGVKIFNFNEIQISIYMIIIAAQFWAFGWLNLEKKLPYKILLTSRYLLAIYFWHLVLFAVISSFI